MSVEWDEKLTAVLPKNDLLQINYAGNKVSSGLVGKCSG